jgi:hypothetical protein
VFSRDFWIQLGVLTLFGLVLLVVLWPIASTGKRLLEKWQVADPSEAQVEDAVRYLKRRRLLYPWLYVGMAFVPSYDTTTYKTLVVVLAGSLLAELLALRPSRDARRVATLTPRGLFDIASKGVLISYAVIVVAAMIYVGIDRRWDLVGWLALSVLVVVVIIWAAVTRPAIGDEVVDMALRTRSVHVSAGLGAGVAGVLVISPWGFLGILAWIAMANTKPSPAKIVP